MTEETSYLFHISKPVWINVCNMFFKMKSSSLRNYLQLYPFSRDRKIVCVRMNDSSNLFL